MIPVKKVYHPVKRKTVLIVDDDRVFVHICQEKLQDWGFKVETASNRHIAMQRLKKAPVDLMILDLCLPGMDGVAVLDTIRSEFDMRTLPVIVLSNTYLSSQERTALEAGATKCVKKIDSTPSQMLELARELLAAGRSNAAAAASGTGFCHASPTPAAQSETEIQESLVATFLISAPETLAKLRSGHQAFAKAGQDDLRRTELFEMHRQLRSLTGSAGLLGFRKIGQMANALEALFVELTARPTKITPSVIRTVAQAIDTLASLFDQTANPHIGPLLPPRVLVVDDEIISRETICCALGKAELAAVRLDDSLAAQRLLEQDPFDLIFLDVEMPGLSGPDLCMQVREMATNRATPVVFVTSHSDFGSRAQSTLSGGSDFIAKPFLLVELAIKALTWLFRENPQSISTATAQQSVPGRPLVLPGTSDPALELHRELLTA